jgi:hypothetical protein
MNDLAERISIERDGFAEILEAAAVARETDAEAERDHRYAEAARHPQDRRHDASG